MDILANELSIHEQFSDIPLFRNAFARLMAMREVARRFGREVYCHRTLLTTNPLPGMTMQTALGHLTRDQQRAARGWLTRHGPFWDDLRGHGPNDWLECQDDIVTDSAVGEAAFRTLHGIECGLVSFVPSNWDYSPIDVIWRREAEGLENQHTHLDNWRDVATLEEMLCEAAPPIRSWDDLRRASMNRFESLTFAEDCFSRLLAGVPFSKGAAERFLVLLGILDRLARAFNAAGGRTPEGQQIHQDYFTGSTNALFSDSSDSEKHDFRNELTFPHPNEPGEYLFCTWHGKVSTRTLRLHYWWSGRAGEPVYVVYAGPKITKR